MSIDTVVFDCGDTLLVLDPPREVICGDALSELGIRVSPEYVKTAYRIVDFGFKQRSSQLRTATDRADFYREFNRRLCHALGIASRFPEVHDALTSAFAERKRWQPGPGTADALARLSGGFSLYVLANWDVDLPELLAATGLHDRFEGIYASAELGAEKPDPRVFDEFSRRSGRSASRCVYVGNEYGADVVGSRARGFTPVLLDHAGFYSEAVDAPRARSWPEAVALIDRITRGARDG